MTEERGALFRSRNMWLGFAAAALVDSLNSLSANYPSIPHLPIREIDTAPGVSPTSGQAIREDYRWLPATQANLRLLTPAGAIPPGFTQAG